jgi:uncharacterized membrane protein YkvA (DUF1232 family)
VRRSCLLCRPNRNNVANAGFNCAWEGIRPILRNPNEGDLWDNAFRHGSSGAERLKVEVYAIYLAYRDLRVPLRARIFAACVVGYAFSPIDLTPDFIPVLGYIDDLVLIPLSVKLALKMIPCEVMAECRERSREVMAKGKPANKIAAAVIVLVWFLLAALGVSVMIDFL